MAQIVKMPDGAKVSFPDDMPKEEIRALIEEKFPDVRDRAAAKDVIAEGAGAAAPVVANMTGEQKIRAAANEIVSVKNKPMEDPTGYATQAMSGVNEGIADVMSLPTAIGNSLLSVGPTVANATLGTDFKNPDYLPDAGKQARIAMEETGMIKPPSDDPAKQMVRRVGKSVGASLPFAPLAPAAVLTSAVGGGLGGAIAEQVAPGNPWAELAGEIIGGFGPAAAKGVIGRMVASKAGPTAEELGLMKNQAYKIADDLGVKYTPKAYQDLVGKVDGAVKADNISVTRHPKAASFVDDMKTRHPNGMSLTELDQLRQEVRRDLLRSTDEAEQHFGKVIIKQIDGFIDSAGQAQVVTSNAMDAAKAIKAARKLNTQYHKTELVEDALYAAKLKAGASGSGGNINNTIRAEFKRILLDDTDRASFTADEIRQMEKIVKPGPADELLRLVGKLSPNGNGLMLALGIGGSAADIRLAAFPVAGALAKAAGDARTLGKVSKLRASVASGASLQPIFTPADRIGGMALGATIVANENGEKNGASLKRIRANALN